MNITKERKRRAVTGLWNHVNQLWKFLTGRPRRYITIELKGDENGN